MKEKVFISYRQATSSDFVKLLANKLKDKFEVLYDQENNGPGDLRQDLKDIIDLCDYFILVVDEETFNFKEEKEKDMVWIEIDHALKKYQLYKSLKIIPLLLNGNEIPDDEKLKNNGITNLDTYKFNWDKYSYGDKFNAFFSRFIKEKMRYDESMEKKKKRQKRIRRLLALVLATGLVFGGTLLQQWISSRTPKLIFAGGGSVANMIKEITSEHGDMVDIEHDKNFIYLNLPSQDAWSLMSEEVMTDHTSDFFKNKFYPVCLSALRAEDSVFTKTVGDSLFTKNGTIISYCLGIDILKVYSNIKELENKTIIEKGLLSKIIKDCCDTIKPTNRFRIYITREGSGTYYTYNTEFPELFNDTRYSNHFHFYDGNLTEAKLNYFQSKSKGKYILLTSHFYTPEDIKKYYDGSPLLIKNSKKDTIICNHKTIITDTLSKPMYLYFAGVYKGKEDNFITIPEEMVRFINRIVPYFETKDKKDKEIDYSISSKMRTESNIEVVTPLYLLKEWQSERNNRRQTN